MKHKLNTLTHIFAVFLLTLPLTFPMDVQAGGGKKKDKTYKWCFSYDLENLNDVNEVVFKHVDLSTFLGLDVHHKIHLWDKNTRYCVRSKSKRHDIKVSVKLGDGSGTQSGLDNSTLGFESCKKSGVTRRTHKIIFKRTNTPAMGSRMNYGVKCIWR